MRVQHFFARLASLSIALAVLSGAMFGMYAIAVSTQAVRCVAKVQVQRQAGDKIIRRATMDRDAALRALVNNRNVDTDTTRKAVKAYNEADDKVIAARKENPVVDPNKVCK